MTMPEYLHVHKERKDSIMANVCRARENLQMWQNTR